MTTYIAFISFEVASMRNNAVGTALMELRDIIQQ